MRWLHWTLSFGPQQLTTSGSGTADYADELGRRALTLDCGQDRERRLQRDQWMRQLAERSSELHDQRCFSTGERWVFKWNAYGIGTVPDAAGGAEWDGGGAAGGVDLACVCDYGVCLATGVGHLQALSPVRSYADQ